MHNIHQPGLGFASGARTPTPPPFDYTPALREAIQAGEVQASNTHFFVTQENAYVTAPLLLGEIKPDKLPLTTYKGPRVPYQLFLAAMQFNLDGYAKIKSEVQITGYLNPTTGEWILWPFKQTGQGLHTQETECPENTQKRLDLLALGYDTQGWCFTMHNHCTASSFQSGTDHGDEHNRPGIHVTIGQLDKPMTDIHVRAVASFNAMVTPSGKVIHAPRTLQWTPNWVDIIDFGNYSHFAEQMENAALTKLLCNKRTGLVTPQEWLDCVSQRYTAPTGVWTGAGSSHFPNGVRSGPQYSGHQSPTKAYSIAQLINQYMDGLIPIDPDINNISASLRTLTLAQDIANCELIMPLKGLAEMMTRSYVTSPLLSDYNEIVSPEKKRSRWVCKYAQMTGVAKIIEGWGACVEQGDTSFPFKWSPQIAAALSFFYASFTYRACWGKTARKTADKSVKALWVNKTKPYISEQRLLQTAQQDWWLQTALSLLEAHLTPEYATEPFTPERAVELLYSALCKIAVNPEAYATIGSMTAQFAVLIDPPTTSETELAVGMALTYGPSFVGLVARALDSNVALHISSNISETGLRPMGNMSVEPKFPHILQRWLPTSNKATVCATLLAALHSQHDQFDAIMSPLRLIMEPHLSDQDFAILERVLEDIRIRIDPGHEEWKTLPSEDDAERQPYYGV